MDRVDPGGLSDIAPADFARLRIEPMEHAQAEAVAAWSYPGVYAFYDFAADAEDLAEMLDDDRRRDRYFAATLPGHGLVGFVELTPAGEDTVEVGLGLAPECTGRRLGTAFVTTVCEWVGARRRAAALVLRVAAFNARAITVYERAGFKRAEIELVDTNGSSVEFVRMTRARPAA